MQECLPLGSPGHGHYTQHVCVLLLKLQRQTNYLSPSVIRSLCCYLHPNGLMVLETLVPIPLPVISCCLSSLYL